MSADIHMISDNPKFQPNEMLEESDATFNSSSSNFYLNSINNSADKLIYGYNEINSSNEGVDIMKLEMDIRSYIDDKFKNHETLQEQKFQSLSSSITASIENGFKNIQLEQQKQNSESIINQQQQFNEFRTTQQQQFNELKLQQKDDFSSMKENMRKERKTDRNTIIGWSISGTSLGVAILGVIAKLAGWW
ncbi:hypothetical protein ERX35_007775 [Macrococcus equipercicus]|uniref:DUF2951 family protein n=1 Tax=Macrococcus equipercicus TaxID=69967 RepID=A0ABQ6R7N6_9STAP|nr:hypothetical protein [Macrococcus equipercicus]KAA1039105.1 hypothetical protein ERX35_007775 [Macrococcus equipercicus]